MTSHVLYSRDDICVLMETLPDTATNKFKYYLDCGACANLCGFHFSTPTRLSFVSVGQLVGVFSLPCRKLGKMAVETGEPVGLPLLESDADDDIHLYGQTHDPND